MKSIISIILIIASISFFIFFTQPKWNELKVNKIEIEKLNIAQENAKKLKSRIESLQKTRNSISPEDTEKIKKMIPDGVENVKLIIDFDNMLQALIEAKGTSGLYKTNSGEKISIESPKITPSTITTEGGLDTSKIGVANFSFTVSLTYSDFIDFLKQIETSTRLFDVDSISFSAPSVINKNPSEIVYNFNINLKTYWLKSK